MEKFDRTFTRKIAAEDLEVLREWITEMDHKMRYTENTQPETKALKRRMRIVQDYIEFHCRCEGDADETRPVREP